MCKTYFLLLVLATGVVLLTTPTTADHQEPLSTEEQSLEENLASHFKPPTYKPPPKHRPPIPFHEQPETEKPFPEHKPPKGTGEKPPQGHFPGHPPLEEMQDSYHHPPVKKYPPKKPPPHKPPTSN